MLPLLCVQLHYDGLEKFFSRDNIDCVVVILHKNLLQRTACNLQTSDNKNRPTLLLCKLHLFRVIFVFLFPFLIQKMTFCCKLLSVKRLALQFLKQIPVLVFDKHFKWARDKTQKHNAIPNKTKNEKPPKWISRSQQSHRLQANVTQSVSVVLEQPESTKSRTTRNFLVCLEQQSSLSVIILPLCSNKKLSKLIFNIVQAITTIFVHFLVFPL